MAVPNAEQRARLAALGTPWPCKDWPAKLRAAEQSKENPMPEERAPYTAEPEPVAESPAAVLTEAPPVPPSADLTATVQRKLTEALDGGDFDRFQSILAMLPADVRSKVFAGGEGEKIVTLAVDKAPDAPATLEPGQKTGNGGLETVREWTREDQVKRYEMVEFMPLETTSVIVNTVRWDLRGYENNRVPSIVRDVYLQRIAAVKEADRWKAVMFSPNNPYGHPGTYTPGSGWASEQMGNPVDAGIVQGIAAAPAAS